MRANEILPERKSHRNLLCLRAPNARVFRGRDSLMADIKQPSTLGVMGEPYSGGFRGEIGRRGSTRLGSGTKGARFRFGRVVRCK